MSIEYHNKNKRQEKDVDKNQINFNFSLLHSGAKLFQSQTQYIPQGIVYESLPSP
jgi:hypothetical protein